MANKNTSTGQVNGPENSRKIQTGPVQEAERDRLTSSPPDKSTGIQTRLLYDAKRDGKENMMSPRQPSSAGQMQSVAVTSMKKFGGSLFKKLSERYVYTEMSSFQGVGIESVYRGVLISGCWNRGVPLYTEVSSFQGVGIEGFHCIQRCRHFRVLE